LWHTQERLLFDQRIFRDFYLRTFLTQHNSTIIFALGLENIYAEENTVVNMNVNENDDGNRNSNRSGKKEKEMKKPKFKALSRNHIAYILMGTTHTQRDEELWKAALK
jgi:hypothetical protein